MRCPFLDQSLVELALQIPYRQKVPALRGDERNKLILKRALSGRLPKDLLYAKKRGFGYFVSEERVLRGAWKQNVDRAFAAFPAANQTVDAKAVFALKSRFDSHGDVPSSLIAKLYALRMAAGVAAGVPEGACSTS
jgi:asparagine synthase (glutamine-hydrolysing)